MSLRFTPCSLYRTNAAKSPLVLDENVTPYWTRSLMLGSALRMTSRTRRITPSDGGLVVLNQRSTLADFGTISPPSVPRRTPRLAAAAARARRGSPSATRRVRTRREPPRNDRASPGGRRDRPAGVGAPCG